MAILETALISALAPAAIEVVKNLIGAVSTKFIGLSVDDQIKIQTADVERLKALAALDNPYGTPSQWVVDLRAAFRYIASGVCVLGGLSTIYFAPVFAPMGVEIAVSAFSFIFGDRLLLNLKGKK